MVTGPNTVSWKRDYSYPEMLVNFVSGNLCSTYDRPMTSRDVCVVNDLFCMQNDLSIYNLLLEEIQSCGIDHEKLFKLWHGNTRGDPGTHLIVRDCNRTHELFIKAIETYLNKGSMDHGTSGPKSSEILKFFLVLPGPSWSDLILDLLIFVGPGSVLDVSIFSGYQLLVRGSLSQTSIVIPHQSRRWNKLEEILSHFQYGFREDC